MAYMFSCWWSSYRFLWSIHLVTVIFSPGTAKREILTDSTLSTAVMGNRCILSDGKTLCTDSHRTLEWEERISVVSTSHPIWTLSTNCSVNRIGNTEGHSCFIVGRMLRSRLVKNQPLLTQNVNSLRPTSSNHHINTTMPAQNPHVKPLMTQNTFVSQRQFTGFTLHHSLSWAFSQVEYSEWHINQTDRCRGIVLR